ncbi:N-acetylmuramoyl-L-alanine amidase family protein [Clostridium butyricum]|uniref:N-acetylmuramoyl-L-alanine amidase family protein n=5 Tax=Clostridium butyricum TaxID=1492 RepID=UPI00051C008A|nr:N-acetylmuramoyl-L-alanine amidase family protein [Clostridium butyricum]ALP91703.1 PspC family transcriptional regulator [Clostridium butyricum]ALS18200.1 PspC family transcriptional regulator [Clostridium butyricum]AOR95272.1 PspC family transcriptional regulator [Clostridium butyricum]MCI3009560.1 N-acetylmuramoyl-L-alanine amidase family protein [Clostridium butyricum]MDB2158879.1 N-acetylmuramoyl-L-alanine amidase family protein [Clostridium butyricum]
MFKRSSKMTALLVAAAAVVSIVPASASERLGTKDGTIDNARAYEGGYVYDGYRTDDDDAALYYNNGSKDVNTDEDEDYDDYTLERYGDKYATVKDGSDEYLLDLSNGKIDNDETLEDKVDNAKNKLKSKLNKEDRYTEFKNGENDFSKEDDKVVANTNSFARVLSDKYGEVWYQFSAAGDEDAIKRTTGAAVNGEVGYYQGFSNDSGKYIDVTQDCNIYAYDTDKDKTVKIEEYGKTYSANNLMAKLDSVTPISQDKDNLYVVAKVVISGDKQKETTQYYLQKISKSQGDKKDGGYLPKETTSYLLNVKMDEYSDNRLYDDGDSSDAADVIMSYVDGSTFDDGVCKNIEVIDGNVYATLVKDSKIKMFKIKLKKDKLDVTEAVDKKGDSKVKDVDVYTAKKDSDWDHDVVDAATSKEGERYSIDADGNTWILDKGKILKSEGTEFKEMYTCDRSIDKLDVYDENNLIAWSSDGDVYTTVAEGKKQTDEDAGVDTDKKDETPVVKAGWDKNADGTWAFYKDGAKVTGWLNDKGTWYYLDAAGTMKTGWVQAGSWYYLNASGAMQTGWVNDNGTWYYCNASGAMQTGWLLDGSTWYYLNANGSMAANTTVDGYVLGANGAML